jgi:hypothetical protein
MNNFLRKIKTARIDGQHLTVELEDGCLLSVPLSFYPMLLLATDQERHEMEVLPFSLHWESLDCDLGIEGLLQGLREHPSWPTKPGKGSKNGWCQPLNLPWLRLIVQSAV